MTASQVSQSMRDSYLSAFEEAVEKATKPQPLALYRSVCEYCTRPNLSNSETCKGCGAPASGASSISDQWRKANIEALGTEHLLQRAIQDAFPYESFAAFNQACALGLVNWRTG